MWPLKKHDPEIDVTPEDAFEFTLLMFFAFWVWQMVFPWWPILTR